MDICYNHYFYCIHPQRSKENVKKWIELKKCGLIDFFSGVSQYEFETLNLKSHYGLFKLNKKLSLNFDNNNTPLIIDSIDKWGDLCILMINENGYIQFLGTGSNGEVKGMIGGYKCDLSFVLPKKFMDSLTFSHQIGEDVNLRELIYKKRKRCVFCGDKKETVLTKIHSDIQKKEWVCPQCLMKYFKYCSHCGDLVLVDGGLYHFEDVYYCHKCLNNLTFICGSCGSRERIPIGCVGIPRLCENCADNQSGEIYFDVIKETSKIFDINPHKTFVGVEIECLKPEYTQAYTMGDLSPFRFSQYEDGSLSGGGMEFSTPPLNGDLLFNQITDFCKMLKQDRYTVNSSCGLHIHLEVEKNIILIKRLFCFYDLYEDFFFNMLPSSRKNNQYCRLFGAVYGKIIKDFNQIKDLSQFRQLLYEFKTKERINYTQQEKYFSKRYAWVNFHSIFYRGTIEIRNHSGTIDPKKINMWIAIHLRILEFLRKTPLAKIRKMENDYNTFLGIFNKKIRKYIIARTKQFHKEVIMDV